MAATLSKIVGNAREVFSDIPADAQPSSSFTKMLFGPASSKGSSISEILTMARVKPLKGYLNNLRVTKSIAEIANLRKAGQASGRAFTDAMRHQWATERDLEAFLDYHFRSNGCEETAYVPVVAGGEVRVQIYHHVSLY